MKTIMGVGVVVVLICGVLGVNTLKVAVNEVKDGVEQQLPTSFRHAVAEKDLDDCQSQLAEAAAEVDLHVLPHYHSAGLLEKMTFADLREADLQPFRSMKENLQAGVEKLDVRMCCATGSRASELQSKKDKLARLADRAAKDLQTLATLQGEFVRLEDQRRKLSDVNPTTVSSLKVELNTNSLASVDRYLADRQREAAAEKYRSSKPSDSLIMSAAELAELKDVLKALDTDVATR